MPKMKTDRGAAKRFKITGSGRLRRRQAFRSHLLEKKSSRRVRRLGREVDAAPADVKSVKRLLGIWPQQTVRAATPPIAQSGDRSDRSSLVPHSGWKEPPMARV
jgi:large subunit ribosomal protein L35